MVSQWFDDVVRGARDIHGSHSTGKLIVKRASDNSEDLIIIDGQQRVTTTFILLAAIRDVARHVLAREDTINTVTNEINTLLFLVTDEISSIEIGQDLKGSKLLPSFYDRKPLFQVTLGMAEETCHDESPQSLAKSVFTAKIHQELRRTHMPPARFFEELIRQSLDLMSVMSVEIVNNINFAQVFVWYQEKSLFGPGALLHNPTPGMAFTAVDMARNLLLSPFMSETMERQEEFYRTHWLQPIESCFHNAQDFNSALFEFIKLKSIGLKHTSESEKTYTKYSNSAFTSMGPEGKGNILAYAKLCSVVEQTVNECRSTLSEADDAAKVASVKILQEFASFAFKFTPF